ncbi:lipocalin family protein [Dyadobacter sp. Leaf189]|uniref:lipocalin family protein n=1 Tax=Dyadobacter sp. Leaf189 TaxID=1736295 RepID=UPI000A9D6FD7|nr:lipocalin family protein [Dyadobacter sp. Leaf189]
MKTDYIKFTLLLLILASCSNGLTTTSPGKKIDNRLVGVWTGSEQDQQIEGAQKIWEMTRNSDGTFLLNFKTIIKGESDEHTEKGNWWVKNGKFYEFHDDSGETDIYKYEVLDNNRIKFISKQINVEMNTESYEFIDTRK